MYDKKNKKIGALWLKKTGKASFLSGVIDNKRVIVFKNNFKKEDREPDYQIYEAIEKKPSEPKTEELPDEIRLEDIPF